MAVGSESDSEDLGDLELKDRASQLDCPTCRVQADPAATAAIQVRMLGQADGSCSTLPACVCLACWEC